MDKLIGLVIKYTHPAYTMDFQPEKNYRINFDGIEYFILDSLDEKRYMDAERIKILFTPVYTTWEELFKVETKKEVFKKKEEIAE